MGKDKNPSGGDKGESALYDKKLTTISIAFPRAGFAR
jgi:hypothetical protein